MNAVEIADAVDELFEESFDPAEFPFEFLQAFGNKETTLKRLRKGDSNASDVPGGVLQRNNVHLAVCSLGEVAAWTAYAATLPQVAKRSGRRVKVSAINAFCALADKFLQVTPGGTVPMVPPTAAFLGDNLTITATAGTGTVTFTSSAANSNGTTTELLLQPLKGKNRTPTAKAYRTKAFKAFATGSLTQVVNVPTGYYAAGYRYVNTITGQATALVPMGLQTVALSVVDGGSAIADPTPAPPQREGVTARKKAA